jgi:hypothetical protein
LKCPLGRKFVAIIFKYQRPESNGKFWSRTYRFAVQLDEERLDRTPTERGLAGLAVRIVDAAQVDAWHSCFFKTTESEREAKGENVCNFYGGRFGFALRQRRLESLLKGIVDCNPAGDREAVR